MKNQLNTKNLKIFGVDWHELDQHPYILKEETAGAWVFTNTQTGARLCINTQGNEYQVNQVGERK